MAAGDLHVTLSFSVPLSAVGGQVKSSGATAGTVSGPIKGTVS